MLAVLGTIAVMAQVWAAWQATQRQEAYLPQLEAEAQRAPGNGPLQAVLGGRLMQAGEYPAAVITLRRAVVTGEQTESVWLALAASTAASGDPGRALADLRIGIHALTAAPALQRALAQAQALGPSAAPLDVAQAISPQGPQPLLKVYGRGSFLNALADWWGRRHPESSGYATRERWASAQPNNVLAQRLWAEALIENQRFAEAQPVVQRALMLDPNSPQILFDQAELLQQSGQLTAATQEYLACLKLRPNWLPALLNFGQIAQQQGLKSYATLAYTRATQVAPRSAAAWIGMGSIDLVDSGGNDYEQAIAAYQTAARLDPQRTDFWDSYADALRQTNHWNQAEALLRRRLAAAPEDAQAHMLLGTVLMDSNPTPQRMTEARAQTEAALQIDPRLASAQAQLGELDLNQGEAAQAIPMFTQSLQISPFNPRVMLLLSRAYQEAGQPKLAAQVNAQAEQFSQEQNQVIVLEEQEKQHLLDPAFYDKLATLQDKIGKSAQAAEERAFARLLRIHPRQAKKRYQQFDQQVNSLLSPH